MENITEPGASFKRTKEEKKHYIDQWRESGKSKKNFCLENNISYLTFIGWTNPKKRKEIKKESTPSSFIPVTLKPGVKQPFAEIQFIDGTRISIHQSVGANYLRSLVR